MTVELFAVGLNHKSAPVELREKLAVADGEHASTLSMLRERLGLSEVMVLSTCNRVEIYGVAAEGGASVDPLPVLAEMQGVQVDQLDGHVFSRSRADAARHVFRVAASLESLVVGEPQILGQVKSALSRAREHGAVGPVLDRCLSLAFKSAKRVRTETEIAVGGASVPSVAVDLARSIFGELDGSAVLVVGAGEMAEASAEHLKAAGASEIVVVNRSEARGQRLADEVGGHYQPWDRLLDQLRRADIVVGSTGSRDPIVDRRMLKPVMKKRRHRPLFFVDIAVPRDINPDVSKLEDVFLYNVDDLQSIVHDNMRSRIGEAERADAIVEEELSGFSGWMRSRAIGPVMGKLQQRGKGIVEAELSRMAGKLGELSPEQRKAVEQLARGVMQKLLHTPMANVRKATGEPVRGFDGEQLADALALLFELEEPPEVASSPAQGAGEGTDGDSQQGDKPARMRTG